MGTPTEDRIEGTIEELKGRGTSAWGSLAGDDRARVEGEIEQLKGKARQGLADVKEAIEDATAPDRDSGATR